MWSDVVWITLIDAWAFPRAEQVPNFQTSSVVLDVHINFGMQIQSGSTVILVIDMEIRNHMGYFFKLIYFKTPHKQNRCTVAFPETLKLYIFVKRNVTINSFTEGAFNISKLFLEAKIVFNIEMGEQLFYFLHLKDQNSTLLTCLSVLCNMEKNEKFVLSSIHVVQYILFPYG